MVEAVYIYRELLSCQRSLRVSGRTRTRGIIESDRRMGKPKKPDSSSISDGSMKPVAAAAAATKMLSRACGVAPPLLEGADERHSNKNSIEIRGLAHFPNSLNIQRGPSACRKVLRGAGWGLLYTSVGYLRRYRIKIGLKIITSRASHLCRCNLNDIKCCNGLLAPFIIFISYIVHLLFCLFKQLNGLQFSQRSYAVGLK